MVIHGLVRVIHDKSNAFFKENNLLNNYQSGFKTNHSGLVRVIHDKSNAFFKENNSLNNYQSGFKTNHSTNLCLLLLTDKILKDFGKGLLTEMILIDLQKTFGTINHKFFKKKPHGCL